MNHDEMVEILSSLADDFERLMDFHNMDWAIFTYEINPPWFYVSGDELEPSARQPSSDWAKEDQKRFKAHWDKANTETEVLRGRFLETIEALRKATEEVT